MAEQGDVQDIGLAGVGYGGLGRCHRRGYQAGLDGIGMDTIVELGERSVEIPRQGQAAILVFLEPLEFLDKVQLELHRNP